MTKVYGFGGTGVIGYYNEKDERFVISENKKYFNYSVSMFKKSKTNLPFIHISIVKTVFDKSYYLYLSICDKTNCKTIHFSSKT